MIALENLRKIYQTSEIETVALAGINLTIANGDFVAVMGPSGCGKSTLMNILGMIDAPSSGQYRFNGKEVSGRRESDLVKLRKEHLGFVFQSFNLISDLNVSENVGLPLRYLRVGSSARKSRVREALELVGLNHRARHKPSQLSGGEQQRVAVARAIVADPDLILADEPTGNLDSRNGDEVMELLEMLNDQGATILMVTHSEKDAGRSKRVIRMLDGAIVEDGQS